MFYVKIRFPGVVYLWLRKCAQAPPPNPPPAGEGYSALTSCSFLPPSGGIEGGHVELIIRDDGRGFDVDSVPPGHFGLGIMQERAASIGTVLEVDSEPGGGTEVRVIWKQGALND